MIPVISLDPASLSLWYDPQLLNQAPFKEELGYSVYYAVLGDSKSLIEHLNGIEDEQVKVKCIHLASSVWHEQRHFLDLVLTNYGALRVRQFFELYINAPTLLSDALEADGKLGCPIDLYADDFRRKLMGLSSLESFMNVGGNSANRKIYLKNDRELLPTFAGKMECGGEAQLEALAYYTQYSSVQDLFGNDISLKVQNEIPKENRRELKYRWAQIVANTYGLVPTKVLAEDSGTVDISFLIPIIYGSLMSRGWKQPQVSSEVGGTHYPLARLAGLLNTLKGKFDDFGKVSLEDGWEIVNQTAKQLWGRTALEELDEDYKREGDWCEQIEKASITPTVKKTLMDFHHLRGRLIDLLKEFPAGIFVPRLSAISGRFLPLPVLAVPAGEFGETPDQWEAVFRYEDPEDPKIKWWWAAIPSQWPLDDNPAFAMKERLSWAGIISEYAPLAKLMMNGRQHRTILGPELVFIEKRLKADLNLDLAIDPLFMFPREIDDAKAYYTLTGKAEAVCDMCKKVVKKPEGHLISPWVFRYSVKNAQLAIDTYGGGSGGYLVFIKDWSPWMLCDACHHKLTVEIKSH